MQADFRFIEALGLLRIELWHLHHLARLDTADMRMHAKRAVNESREVMARADAVMARTDALFGKSPPHVGRPWPRRRVQDIDGCKFGGGTSDLSQRGHSDFHC